MDRSLLIIEFSAMTLLGGLLVYDHAEYRGDEELSGIGVVVSMIYTYGLCFIAAMLFLPPVPSAAPQPPEPEPFTYAAAEFRVGYDISDDQPIAYIKDSQGESPLPIDHIEEHPGPRELIVEGDWVTLRLPQEKE